jgi:hypothetical protein
VYSLHLTWIATANVFLTAMEMESVMHLKFPDVLIQARAITYLAQQMGLTIVSLFHVQDAQNQPRATTILKLCMITGRVNSLRA